jgi:flagellar biogenesis protein FliO
MGGTLELFLRLAISMAVVMAVMGGAARLLRRRSGGGPRGGAARGQKSRSQPVEVLYRRSLSKGTAVVLVQAGDKKLLLGVTERAVALLADLHSEPARPALEDLPVVLDNPDDSQRTGRKPVLQGAVPALSDNAWKLALDSLRERTVRR